jgi:hypothetical protein
MSPVITASAQGVLSWTEWWSIRVTRGRKQFDDVAELVVALNHIVTPRSDDRKD